MDARTRRTDISSTGHKIKWGTATLGHEPIINIHLGNPKAEPIPVKLTQPVTLGRAEKNDPNVHANLLVCEAAQKGVSRHHAYLEQVDKTVMLTDLNSTNGTFLNGHQLFGKQRRIVGDEDEIRLGQLVMYISYEKPISEPGDAHYKAIMRYAHDLE